MPSPAKRGRELGGALRRAIGDEGDRGAARGEAARGELRNLTGADEQHAAPVEPAEHLLGQCRRGRRDRGRALGDRRLGAHLLAGVQRLAEEPVEHRPGRAGLERRPDLAEDLALARNERVEAGGDPEEVQRRSLVREPVDDRARARSPARPLIDSSDARARALLRVVARRGRARSGCRSRDRPPRRPSASDARELRRLRAAARRPAPARATGVPWCERPTSVERHEKWVTGRPRRATTTSAKPASAR